MTLYHVGTSVEEILTASEMEGCEQAGRQALGYKKNTRI